MTQTMTRKQTAGRGNCSRPETHVYEVDSNFIEFPDGSIGKALCCLDCGAWLNIAPADPDYDAVVERAERNTADWQQIKPTLNWRVEADGFVLRS